MNAHRITFAGVRTGLFALALILLPHWSMAQNADPSAAETPTPAATAADELLIDGIVVNQLGAGVSGAQVRIESPDAAASAPPLVETVTGSRGDIHIKLARPAGDELRYRVAIEGFTEQVGTLDISDPDEVPFIDVTLQGAAGISGTITAARDAKPVGDAKIECSHGGRTLVTRSDSTGKYEFNSIYFGPALITVSAAGHGTQRQQVMVEDDRVTLDFALQPERPVRLTVVTNTDRPAKDVLIEAIAEPMQIRLSATTDASGQALLPGVGLDATGLNIRLNGRDCLAMRGYDEHLELPASTESQASATTQPATDQPGTIQPGVTRPNPARSDIARSDIARSDIARSDIARPFTPPAVVEGRFVVTLAGRIGGKVTDKLTGQAIHNVRVRAGREPRYDMPMDWTGPAGSYELIGVEPGVVTVTFQHSDHATAFYDVDLDTGKTSTLDVSLEPGVPLGGIVKDDQGLPVSQVRVVADKLGEYQTLGLRAVTDEQGRFQFAHVPASAKEIEFSFVRPGYGRPRTVVLATDKTDHEVELESTALPLTSGAAPIDDTKLKPGESVPDLEFTAMDGTSYKLSELRGKYVFIDCWASWCRPCMAEIPNVRSLHEATRDRADFVLIGISLDTDAKALKKTCEDHRMTWPQVFGPKSGASEAFEALDGVGIPYTCLIGPDGKLIAQHLRGPGMVEQVEKAIATSAQEPQKTKRDPN